MPLQSDTPAAKRRVRTGCLPCRKRRRKCDECKPSCDNCLKRGAQCQYPGFKYVSIPGYAISATSNGHSSFHDAVYGALDAEADAQTHRRRETSQVLSDVLNHERTSPLQERRQSQSTAALTTDAQRGHSQIQVGRSRTAASNDSSSPGPLLGMRPTSNAARETSLLCHFRYSLAPWLDISDSSAFFGVKLFLLAREHRAIKAAVLSTAARQLLLKEKLHPGSQDLECCLHYRQEAESRSFQETGPIQQLTRLLLLLEAFLGSSPRQWRDVALELVRSVGSTAFEAKEQSLWWACFRVDLAAAIVAGLPPLSPYHTWNTRKHTSPFPQDSVTNDMAPLFILARSLYLTYSYTTELVSGSEPTPLEDEHPQVRWMELWTSCQTWYRQRSDELCPVLKCRAVEAGQVDPSSPASFPIELYSSGRAVLLSVAYHLASLLLLSCKPRLVNPQTDSKRVLSESWHIQSIAGIATRNDFKEQWDPVLIAGLVHIGPRMTHESQQEALLSCLARAMASTGLMLDHEMQALRAGWVS